jgi:hypothetical protein
VAVAAGTGVAVGSGVEVAGTGVYLALLSTQPDANTNSKATKTTDLAEAELLSDESRKISAII